MTMHILRSLTLLAALTATFALSGSALASTADAATKTNASSRKAAYVDNCVRCETRACPRDGAKTAGAKGQANATHSACSPQLGVRYFPAEEQHLAAYLDSQRCQPD
jgi:hypothetical protein